MLLKTLTYTAFDDKQYTEDYYFNLTIDELAELGFGGEGGLGGIAALLKEMTVDTDGGIIVKAFKDIISKAYGVRSDDGKRFKKTPEALEEFFETGAYSHLFLQLLSNAEFAAEFLNGIVPADLAKKLEKINEQNKKIENVDLKSIGPDKNGMGRVESVKKEKDKAAPTFDDYSHDELLTMSKEEFNQLMDTSKNISREVLQIGMRRSLSEK